MRPRTLPGLRRWQPGHVHQRHDNGTGIKARHGYVSERYRIHPEYLVKLGPALGGLVCCSNGPP